jgi:hypothetical protein
MMNRRGFISSLIAGASAAAVDPEQHERLIWRPKLISIPAPPPAWESYLVTLVTRDVDKLPDIRWGWSRGDLAVDAPITTIYQETMLGQFRERLGLTREQFERRYGHVIDGRPSDFFEAHLGLELTDRAVNARNLFLASRRC